MEEEGFASYMSPLKISENTRRTTRLLTENETNWLTVGGSYSLNLLSTKLGGVSMSLIYC